MSLLSVPLKTVLMYHADATNETLPTSYEYCDGRTLNSGTHDIGGGGSSYTLPDLRNRFILGADITKGAGVVGGTTNSASDAPGPKGVGGAHAKTLAVSEIPAHTHTATTNSAGSHTHAGSSSDSGGAHTHTASTSTAGAHTHAGSSTNTTGGHVHAGSGLSTDGAHVHTISDPGHSHTFAYAIFTAGAGSSGNLVQGGGSTTTSSSTTGITINSTGAHSHTLTITSDGSHSHTLTMTSDGDHTHSITVNSSGAHSHSLSIVSDGAHTHTFTSDATGGGTSFDTRPRYYGLVFIMKVRL